MSKLTDNIDKARALSRERLDNAKDLASEGATLAKDRMSESKRRAADLLGEGKSRAADGVAATREVARKAVDKSGETVSSNPLSVVLGGIALGAIIGALLPKSKAETKYVGGAGRKINDTAKKAYGAAKEAGQEQINDLGLNTDSLRDQFKDLFGKAIEAAKSAATAAGDSVKSDNSGK